jgi:hypothetical protein
LNLNYVDATSGGVAVQLSSGSIVLDPDKLVWNLTGLSGKIDAASLPGGNLRGSLEFILNGSAPLLASDIRQYTGDLHLTPHDILARPPAFAQPIDQFTEATLILKNGILNARQLRAGYGNDVWYIKEANVDLTALPKEIRLRDAAGCLTFGMPRAKYPPQIEKVLAQVNPSGPWFFETKDTRVMLASPHEVDYQAVVHTGRGLLVLNNGRLPVYNINTSISVTPDRIEIDHFNAGVLRGEIQLGGWMKPREQARYSVDATVRGLNLNDLMRAVEKPGGIPTPLSGRANARLSAQGFVPSDNRSPIDVITGEGIFEVRDGDFWRIPVMQQIAKDANARSALTVGEAAGVFDISHSAIHLHPATASAPLLGIEGTGDITFKGNLNLDLIATPLGNWSEKADARDNGIISGFVGTLQKGFNVATKTVLYNVHVAGSPNHPDVHTVPAPIITKQATDLVNFLKTKSRDSGLLNFTQQQPSGQRSN